MREIAGRLWKNSLPDRRDAIPLDDPTDDELRQFDRNRAEKKVSNEDWENPNDPDARITRMKDGTTRMAYKAEHAVDLDSDLIVSATVHPGNAADTATVVDTAMDAATNLEEAGCENEVKAIVADKGYHSTKAVLEAAEFGMQAYIPERARHSDDGPTKIRVSRGLSTRHDDALRVNTASSCREPAASWSNDRSPMSATPEEPDAPGSVDSRA